MKIWLELGDKEPGSPARAPLRQFQGVLTGVRAGRRMAPAKRDLAQHVPDGKPLVCFRGVAQRVGRGDRNLESGRLDGESQVLELADTRDGVEVVMVTTPSNDIVPKRHGIGDPCIRRHRGRNVRG